VSATLAAWIYRWRLPLTGCIIAGALLSIPRANITHIDNDITAWFSKQDPVYQDYERFRAEFGGTRSLIIALKAETPDALFASDTLAFIQRITGDIERVDTVERVASLATATIVEATPDGGLDVHKLIEDSTTTSPADVRRRALADDLIRGDLVSSDATVTALVVTFDEDRIDSVRAGVIQRIHNIVDPQLPRGVTAYYNGSLEISETYNRVTLANQQRFTPPILLFTVGAIFVTFRSWRKTLLSMIAVLVSVLWTLGLYSLMGFTYNVLSSMITPLIVVLAIADDVHMMQHWDEERRHGDNEHAFKATVAHLAAPLLGASATTALGMLSLATSNVVAVRAFGVGSAVGIMMDFVISLILVPTLLTWVRPETAEAPHERYFIGPLQRVARFSCAYPARVVAVSLVIGLIAALGILRLRVDTNHINFFRATHPLSRSASVIDKELSGVYSFQIMLEGPPDSLKTPDALQRIDRLAQSLRAFPHVRKVTSVVDYVKRINKELNDGRPEASVVPHDANTIAQELFVFGLGGEGREELDRVVSTDYSRAQLSIKLESMSSDLVLQLVEAADALAKSTFTGTGIEAFTTGSGRLFSTLDHYLVTSQLSSFVTAFITVFGVIFIVFRSARFGLLTIVPNVLPVVAVLGVMGYLDISMNIATVMLASVALGVVDDDTIHFINRYRKEVARGATTDAAIAVATAHEGRASLTTALINSCGFGVLLLSEYRPTAWFGGLLALTLGVAFLAEVFILPATIKLTPRIFGADALRRGTITALLLTLTAASVAAQTTSTNGNVTIGGDLFPNRDHTAEIRSRIFVEELIEPAPTLRIVLSGFVDGLVAQRPTSENDTGLVTDGVVGALDGSVSWKTRGVDLLAGFSRISWGRLDELQPTDVVNPLDASRFFFESRSEARLPVGLVRVRGYLTENTTIEGVYVPFFRRGRFDQLDEPTSPFNVEQNYSTGDVVCLAIGCPTLPPVEVTRQKPQATWSNGQGGVRLNATSGRVDWSVSVYRGLEPFGFGTVGTPQPTMPVLPVDIVYPRFTMLGGDFETVHGEWGMRGEVAVFVDDNFQGPLRVVPGSSIDAGIGVDRQAGAYRVSATALVHHESYAVPVAVSDGTTSRSDLSLILAADRTFSRERYRLRTFGVYTPDESNAFLRAIGIANLRDNLALEGSVGWFAGTGQNLIGTFADSDFVYARLKYYF